MAITSSVFALSRTLGLRLLLRLRLFALFTLLLRAMCLSVQISEETWLGSTAVPVAATIVMTRKDRTPVQDA